MNKSTRLDMGKFILTLIFCIGFFLRIYNVNWDQGLTFHPDERNIDAAVSRIHFFDKLNPEFFAYGGLTIYLYRIIGEVVSQLTNDASWLHDWGHINIIGRSSSAFFSSLTIIAVYFLAKKFTSKTYAIVASIISTFTVTFIQIAHFAITESLLSLLVTLSTLLSINLYKQKRFFSYILTALVVGLSAAAKTSGLSFALPFLLSHFFIIFETKNVKQFFLRNIFFTLSLALAVLIFIILSPYTFLDWTKFTESMRYESGVVRGTLPVPYTLQFTNTPEYVYQIGNLFWLIGPILLLVPIGLITLIFFAKKKSQLKEVVIFLSFPFAYFSYVGSWHTKFIRYMHPLVPFLIILATFTLFIVHRKSKVIGKIFSFIYIAVTILWALAYFSIYTRVQTRISASKWIYRNIPSESSILTEHWDDGLPVTLAKYSNPQAFKYNIKQIEIYKDDRENKANYLATTITPADYIILNSRRLWGTIINLEEKYPITSAYYKKLFDGSLGYEKVAEFSSYPSLGKFEINDNSSEETFQVYDHPTVMIFKNTKKYSLEKIYRTLVVN